MLISLFSIDFLPFSIEKVLILFSDVDFLLEHLLVWFVTPPDRYQSLLTILG